MPVLITRWFCQSTYDFSASGTHFNYQPPGWRQPISDCGTQYNYTHTHTQREKERERAKEQNTREWPGAFQRKRYRFDAFTICNRVWCTDQFCDECGRIEEKTYCPAGVGAAITLVRARGIQLTQHMCCEPDLATRVNEMYRCTN